MNKFAILTATALLLLGCNQAPPIPKVDAAKLRPGMTGAEVRKAAGEPFPGATNTNLTTGFHQETWIYPSGDNAVLVVLENDRVKSIHTKRVTMKDVAKKVRNGMTLQEVTAALGHPSGLSGDVQSRATATYVNEEAALDDLTIHFENGVVTKSEVNPNSALSR